MDKEKEDERQKTVPVVEERLVTGTRKVKTGTVRVQKKVERIRKTVDMPTVRDVVRVSRIPVNRVVKSIPEIRKEGDTIIVPVVEEEVVVEKRLVLKEEIHIHKRQIKGRVSKEVSLARENATVERLDSEGKVVEISKSPSVQKTSG